MKKIKFIAMMFMALTMSMSFTSCDDDILNDIKDNVNLNTVLDIVKNGIFQKKITVENDKITASAGIPSVYEVKGEALFTDGACTTCQIVMTVKNNDVATIITHYLGQFCERNGFNQPVYADGKITVDMTDKCKGITINEVKDKIDQILDAIGGIDLAGELQKLINAATGSGASSSAAA